jgi:hypothetical protein
MARQSRVVVPEYDPLPQSLRHKHWCFAAVQLIIFFVYFTILHYSFPISAIYVRVDVGAL